MDRDQDRDAAARPRSGTRRTLASTGHPNLACKPPQAAPMYALDFFFFLSQASYSLLSLAKFAPKPGTSFSRIAIASLSASYMWQIGVTSKILSFCFRPLNNTAMTSQVLTKM